MRGAWDQNPSTAGAALFTDNDPLDWVNNVPDRADAHHSESDIEANVSPSESSIALPEPSTWGMMGLWFAVLALASFRYRRKRPPALFP